MTIALQQEISYSIRKSILDSTNNDIILLLQWRWRLIARCNAGLGSHIRVIRVFRPDVERRKAHRERYLSTMWHLILENQTMHTEGYSVMDGSWIVEDG